jgi:hypothetical protein
MKVSYSVVKGRASSHCITWQKDKKRSRKFFRTRMEALAFKFQKEEELGIDNGILPETELIFHQLAELKAEVLAVSVKLDEIQQSSERQEKGMLEMRKPPAPKILRVAEAAKALRVSSRKLYYLLEKGVFKRYKLPHTRTTFIKLAEVEKALGEGNIGNLLE